MIKIIIKLTPWCRGTSNAFHENEYFNHQTA